MTVLGGVHATFMYNQVLAEAPWIDAIVRGEGEEILVELVRAVEAGRLAGARAPINGIAYREDGEDRRDPGGADGEEPRHDHRRLVHPRVGQI